MYVNVSFKKTSLSIFGAICLIFRITFEFSFEYSSIGMQQSNPHIMAQTGLAIGWLRNELISATLDRFRWLSDIVICVNVSFYCLLAFGRLEFGLSMSWFITLSLLHFTLTSFVFNDKKLPLSFYKFPFISLPKNGRNQFSGLFVKI